MPSAQQTCCDLPFYPLVVLYLKALNALEQTIKRTLFYLARLLGMLGIDWTWMGKWMGNYEKIVM